MECEIKEASIDNLRDVQNLNSLLFKKEYKEFDNTLNCNWTLGKTGENFFRERIIGNNGCVFIALKNNKIIGYLAGEIREIPNYRTLTSYSELENMFVLEEFRGMGIGTKLVERFKEWCKSRGIARMKVSTSSKNKNGIDFYRKNGFFDYELTLETVFN